MSSETENNRSKDAKKEELAKQIRKRVASEERAFRIVERLVDVTVSFERLKEMAHFLLPAHYKDITEERAIAKLCGYPVCETTLGNVQKQKYQISTKTNTVYDITEKKNFCSSKCFKQSKIFEKQILKSPLWTRELEKPADFIQADTKTGWIGSEVISKKTQLDDLDNNNEDESSETKVEASSILDSQNWINELQETLMEEKASVCQPQEEQTCENLKIDEDDTLDTVVEDENKGFDLRDVSKFLEEQMSDDEVCDRISTGFDSDDDPDSTVETSLGSGQKKQSDCTLMDHIADELSSIKEEDLQGPKNDSVTRVDYFKQLLSCKKKGLSSFIDDVPSRIYVKAPHPTENIADKVDPQSASVETQNLPTSESALSSFKLPSNQYQIQNKLHSWITQESLEYLGITKEKENVEESESARGNPDFAKLCDRLDMRGMEFDELLEERLPQTVHAPKKDLPSYDELKNETGTFSLKVKEYYKTPSKTKGDEKSDNSKPVYVVPLVGSLSQMPIRRSIVIQQLGKRLPNLLNAMDIIIGEISIEIKELLSTFNLQNNTIVFKPAEWSVIGIFLIFMLSKKLEKLRVALQVPKVQDKFTEILNTFNLTFQEAQQILDSEILLL